ncbi:MAG: Gldg family protein [Candidatus Pseudobacter hemicellulosilyticus]|uniref:Gldg family protein n=1 Tax=Candidatus Pseudobacter hemicellulosilyticus TaxID=3121375 RepID=A0AAJ5WU25_9BACT|nr:MAG: Gldg family protein [Pseudobacter sp.]
MKIAFRIARLELSNLFYSPVAWVVLVIFMIQSGFEYSTMLERFERAQQLGMGREGLTNTIFAGFMGVFVKMKQNLYLYIPLLTMGLISRETGSGSIKLVFSSPVRISAVVWGKYLAMVVYCLLLMGCLVVLGITSGLLIKDADLPFITSGILGLFLQICAYSAIGLFMSALTTYQVVAAISTLALLAGLNYVGGLWQDMDFVRDLTYFLSISGRVDQFIEGLISTKDIAYFLIIVGLFVGLTILKLKGSQESRSKALNATLYTCLVAGALLLGYISSRPVLVGYKDMTANKSRTLTENSQAILKQLKKPLKVTTYVNLLDVNYYSGLPASRNNDLARYDRYFRFKNDISVDYVYYYDTANNPDLYQRNKGLGTAALAKKMASTMKLDINMFLTPAQIRERINLEPEQNRLVRVLEHDGKTSMLRMYDDLMRQPNEKEFAAALKRLAAPSPKIVFTKGHNERSIRRMGDQDYKLATSEITFRYSLVNQGFDVAEVSLEQEAIPADAAVLVVADPAAAFSAAELEKLQQFIGAGGNLFILGEPKKQSLLNPLLAELGVQLDPGVVLQQSADFAPALFQTLPAKTGIALIGGKSLARLRNKVIFPSATTISWSAGSPFTITPLISMDSASLVRTAPVEDSLRSVNFTAALQDKQGAFPVVVALTRTLNNKEQRIVVAGDADFMSNTELLRSNPQSGNFLFTTELFRWFSYDAFPIEIYRNPMTDDAILTNDAGVNRVKWLLVGVLPAILVAGVALMLLRRKRR